MTRRDAQALMAATALAELVPLINMVPPATRRFTVTEREARNVYGLSDDLRADAIELGLPAHASPSGDHFFERLDVQNLAFWCQTRSPQAITTRTWAVALSTFRQGARGTCRVRYMVKCPDPGHKGDCEFQVRGPRGVLRIAARAGSRVATEVFELSPLHPVANLPTLLHDLAVAMTRYRFWLLPDACRESVDFMRKTGLADCAGAARLLAADAERHDYECRTAFGLILATPYCAPHTWMEVRVGDAWVAIDPVLTAALQQWGHLRQNRRVDEPISGAVLRLASRETWLASHLGQPIPATVALESDSVSAGPPRPGCDRRRGRSGS